MRLGSNQPQVSAQLRRLRALTGDALLVRAGNAMTPTETAMQLLGPATVLLREADRLFGATRSSAASRPAPPRRPSASPPATTSTRCSSPSWWRHVKRLAPQVRLELLPLSGDYDYPKRLAAGEVDLVIGNWLRPPGELHLGRLIERRDRLPGRRRLSQPRRAGRPSATWRAEHVAPMPFTPSAPRRGRRPPGVARPEPQRRRPQRPLRPDPDDGGADACWC